MITHNTISMMSSLVGVPQYNSAKKVNKETSDSEKIRNEENFSEVSEEGNETQEATKASKKGSTASAQGSTQTQSKHQLTAAQRRAVAEDLKPENKEVKGEETAQAAKGQNAKTSSKPSSLFYDTSRLIQHNFKSTVDNQQDSHKLRPDIQRRQFAENLKKWVQLEYNQFTKDADPLYTRRNLREILNALGDSDSKTQKSGSKEDSTGKNQVGLSKFNKYNISQASNALKLFEEMSLPEPPKTYGDLELVA